MFRNEPLLLNIKCERELWHSGTGKDGEPQLEQFRLLKQALINKDLATEVRYIEGRTKLEMEELWQQLRKQLETSHVGT